MGSIEPGLYPLLFCLNGLVQSDINKDGQLYHNTNFKGTSHDIMNIIEGSLEV